jgi:putative glutamine amidotransferase
MKRNPSSPHPRPVVLIPACNRQLGAHPFQVVGDKYVQAVRLAGCVPLVVPNADDQELEALLALADGVFLTGSPSNVHPSHFGEAVHDARLPLDPRRDDWTLAAIPRALDMGLPLFAICRGFQEMNVALGGSLLQAVQEVPGLADHRADDGLPVEIQYGPSHEMHVEPGGLLARLLETPRFQVNSLHGQGIARLAQGLRIEARAPDGLIEAFSAHKAPAFALGVQWHPEWLAAENPISVRLLQAFGAACQAYRDTHRPPSC